MPLTRLAGTQGLAPHGNVHVQTLLLSLVRDPRFPDAAKDIVIETASARYQDAIDRFVRGDEVESGVLRKAWEDHAAANSLGVQAEELIRAVRAVNASLTETRRLRVIAGDPPYDMSAWQAQTLVSLLERDHTARIFNIWTLNRSVELPEKTES